MEKYHLARLCPAAVQLLPFVGGKSLRSLCCWSARCFGELLDSPLRHSAHTRCLSSWRGSLPAPLSAETFPGKPGHREGRSRARRARAARGPVWCGVLPLTSTKHPAAALSSRCPIRMGAELEEQDSKIPLGQNQDSLREEGTKEKKTSGAKAILHSLAPADRCPASVRAMAVFEKSCSPQFYCRAWRYMVWDISLVSLGRLSQRCPLPAYLLGGQSKKQRRSWCCVSTI